MEKVKDIIKSLDLFGSHIHINYRNKIKVKNLLGGAMTLAVSALTVLLAYLFSVNIFLKDRPLVRFHTENLPLNETSVDISEDFPIVITIFQKGGLSIPNITNYLQVTPYLRHTNFVGDISRDIYDTYPSKFVECDPDKHYGSYKKMILSSPMLRRYMYCLETEKATKIIYKDGGAGSKVFGIRFDLCDSSVANSTCAETKKIEEKLMLFGVTVLIPDSIFNPENYQKPIDKAINDVTFNGSFDSYSNYVLSFKKMQVITDSGWFSEEKSQINSTLLSTSTTEALARDNNNMINIIFSSSTSCDRFSRSYIKIQEILASIGGVINIIYIFGNIVLRYIGITNFYLSLAKNTLFFNELEDQEASVDTHNQDFTRFFSSSKANQLTELKTEAKADTNLLISLNNVESFKGAESEQIEIIRLKNNEESLKSSNRKELNFDRSKDNLNKIDSLSQPSKISLPVLSNKLLSNISDFPVPFRNKTFTPGEAHAELLPMSRLDGISKKNINYERRLSKSLTELKSLKKEDKITKENVTFLHCLHNYICKRNRIHTSFFDSLIEYFQNQLDIRNFLNTKYDLEIMKFLFFSERADSDELFNLKIPVEEVLYYHDRLNEKLDLIENSKNEINKHQEMNKTLRLMRKKLSDKKLFD